MIPEVKQMYDSITAQLRQELKLKANSNKNTWLSILGGTAILAIIGGFIYVGRYYLAAAITGVIITGIVQVLWMVYADNRAEDLKQQMNIMVGQQQQQLEFVYNRMNYLIDIALKVDPVTAHSINNVPTAPAPVEPEEYMMPELGTAGDVMVRRVKE